MTLNMPKKTQLGMRLIAALAKQANVELHIERHRDGSEFVSTVAFYRRSAGSSCDRRRALEYR